MKRILFLALVLFCSLKGAQAQTSTCGTIPFTVTVTQTQQILCNGQCNAVLTSNISGGVGPFSLMWNPGGATTQTVTGLCAGTYQLVVVDGGQGQTCLVTVNVMQPPVLTAITTQMPPSCATACDGFLAGTQMGGTGGYMTMWTNLTTGLPMGSNPSQSNICNGTYQYCVSDANGCTDCDIQVVNAAPCSSCSLVVTTNIQPAICTSSTGNACVGVSGGSGSYSYLWGASAGSQTTSCASNIPAGNHCVTITDLVSGCDTVICMNVGTSTSPIVATAIPTHITCFGLCNGSIVGLASGGTGPYQFSINGGATWQSSGNFSGLCPGVYVLMALDVNGCQANYTFIITQPTQITFTTSITNASCAGCSDGAITINVNGGVPGYVYSINGGSTYVASSTFGSLPIGTYSVCVQDANGCTVCQLVNIISGGGSCNLTVTTNIQPTICTSSTGTACVAVSGGSGNYSYLWSTSQTTSCASGIPAGNHCVTITDLTSGCDTVICMNVNATASPVVTTAITQSTCTGFCYGGITAAATGGTGPYTFSVDGSPFQSSTLFAGLCAGVHILTAQDANGCQAIYTFVISNNISITSTVTQPSCPTCCDGSISSLGSGGGAPYSYQLTLNGVPQSGFAIYNNLCNGTYISCVTDAGFCTACETITLMAPGTNCNFSVTTTIQPAICTSSTGSICVGVTGGSGNYSYLWGASAGSQTTSCATGIPSGNHCVTITDLSTACDTVICVNVNSTTSNVVASGIVSPASCNGTCDGTFTAVATGGTGPYTYSVGGSPFQSSTLFTGLCPGVHILTAKDFYGCTAIFTFIITQPPAVVVTYTATPPSCATACDGSIIVSASGGSAPYMYTVNSNPGPFNNLCNGTYVICATDGNGCTDCETIVFNTTTPCNPCGFTINSTVQPAMCTSSSGTACVAVGGGTGPFTYLWSASAGSQTTSCATNLPGGNHCVTIFDTGNSNCDSTICVNVGTSTANIVATAIPTNPTCNGVCDGQITAFASGGTQPYTYSLDNGPYQSSNMFTGVCAGVHVVYAKDAYGCTGIYTVMLTQPAAVVAATTVTTPPSTTSTCDGTLNGTATGGTGAFIYSWSILGGSVVSTQATLTGACDTTYIFCATDANGCTNCDTIVVNASNSIAEWNSNTFSVYPNPANGECFIQTAAHVQAHVQILDALGRIKLNTRMNGTSLRIDMSGSDWSSGMYIVKISNSTHNYSVRVVKK